MKKLVLLLFFACCNIYYSSAQTTVIDSQNIKYEIITGTQEAKVITNGTLPTGNICVQSSVNIGGSSYSVTSVDFRAFINCINLTGITIPNSVTSIGTEVFHGCTNLASVNLGDSITEIGPRTFYNIKITSIVIPSGVSIIEEDTFDY